MKITNKRALNLILSANEPMIKQAVIPANAPWNEKKVKSERVPFTASGPTESMRNLSKLPNTICKVSLSFAPKAKL